MEKISGYYHQKYAEAFADLGKSLPLHLANGWLLQKNIPNTEYYDVTSCYPFLCCQHWDKLALDLAELNEQNVSLTIVTDPMAAFRHQDMVELFDMFKLYKQHYIVDLTSNYASSISVHHQREIKRATGKLYVNVIAQPITLLPEWLNLYNQLISRHHIKGITAFSENAFRQQLNVPGLVMLAAYAQQCLAGIALWYQTQHSTYYHLTAYNELGYKTGASYALMAASLDYFCQQNIHWACLGAGAGAYEKQRDGLAEFKAGFATTTKPVYLAGKILNPTLYQRLSEQTHTTHSRYFPAYRDGEYA
ncbi:GNAT family N-acetyltransferase [Methylocucumis oryzae]|uniref:BioF2-like acetyltransferase domain-containing protein n=1 Tax=Methylocucumis oryzae TaxID=1632867 RepID=A0A0F3IFM5_9GAMM|nr:hypothetical protein [Methylocucumis oryzae]KJV05348.1 hypothetical protein VZ94_18880 [Methylocucumis oryzae]